MKNIAKLIGIQYQQRTITRDLVIGLTSMVSITLVLGAALYYYFTISQVQKELDRYARETAEKLADILSVPMWTLDIQTIQKIGESFQQSKDVASIQISDELGHSVFTTSSGEKNLITASQSIRYKEHSIGSVAVSLSRQSIRDMQFYLLLSTILSVCLAVLTMLVVSNILLQKFLSRPLNKLIQSIDTIATGDYDHVLPPVSQTDMDEIVQRVNAMARQISERVEALRTETTERKQIEQELRQYQEHLEDLVSERTAELESLNRELESFAYSISHDLRAPLRHMDGYSFMILEDFGNQIPAEAAAYLQRIRDSAQRMNELIDGLLKFSRLSRQQINRQTVEPETIVKFILDELESEMAGRQIKIQIGTLPACQADPLLLRQVYTNLISNAIKYTRYQTQASIEIDAIEKDGQNVYFVKDNGVGFDMHYADKLFGVFQRLHPDKEYEGTGVGLAIVQRIIRRHGGGIWVESAVNQGTTFYFTLSGPVSASTEIALL